MPAPTDGGPHRGPGNPDNGSPLPAGDPDPWQEARDRVLLYLKKLGMPAIQSLEIALLALRRAAAEAASHPASDRPLALAMRALHGMFVEDARLLKRTPRAGFPVLYRRWLPEEPAEPERCTVADAATGRDVATLPPIRRKSMTMKRL